MMIANLNGKRVRPKQTGERATCPNCGGVVGGWCGVVVVWHWTHMGDHICDYGEGEGEWHMGWKDDFEKAGNEIEVKIGNHRADVVINEKLAPHLDPDIFGEPDTILEIQHSPIDSYEIENRNSCFGKTVWLFDGSKLGHFLTWSQGTGKYGGVFDRGGLFNNKSYFRFHWRRARRNLEGLKTFYIDNFNETLSKPNVDEYEDDENNENDYNDESIEDDGEETKSLVFINEINWNHITKAGNRAVHGIGVRISKKEFIERVGGNAIRRWWDDGEEGMSKEEYDDWMKENFDKSWFENKEE